MTEVIINNKSIVSAEGTHTTKGCKEVFCITDRRTFTSVLDAAAAYNAATSDISRCCNGKSRGRHTVKGKRFCFLKDIAQHLDEIFEEDRINAEKAKAYDEITARERAAKEAEEKRAAELAKAEQEVERSETRYNKLAERLIDAQTRREKAYEHLRLLRETNAQYAF